MTDDARKPESTLVEGDVPPTDPEALAAAAQQLEPQDQQQVVQTLMASISMQGQMPSPIQQKVNEEHITAAIDLVKCAEDHEHEVTLKQIEYASSSRWFLLAVVGIVVSVLLVLVFWLKDSPALLTPTLSGLFGLGAGAMGGYGYGRSRGGD